VTYAHKLEKAEARLDWNAPAEVVARKVRAFDPWPVAEAQLGGELLRIWKAAVVHDDVALAPGSIVAAGRDGIDVACAGGVLRLVEVQRAGGRRIRAADLANSRPIETAQMNVAAPARARTGGASTARIVADSRCVRNGRRFHKVTRCAPRTAVRVVGEGARWWLRYSAATSRLPERPLPAREAQLQALPCRPGADGAAIAGLRRWTQRSKPHVRLANRSSRPWPTRCCGAG
jgi:hypothetical protein